MKNESLQEHEPVEQLQAMNHRFHYYPRRHLVGQIGEVVECHFPHNHSTISFSFFLTRDQPKSA
jgi:hypothetical protein